MNKQSDVGLLIGRLFMAVLFLWAGLGKVRGWPGPVGMMQADHVPFPWLGAIFATAVELAGGALLVLGVRTRILALVMAVYTAATTYFAHRFWLMHGAAVLPAEINFYKNVAIIGGFFLLASAGPGRFAVDRR